MTRNAVIAAIVVLAAPAVALAQSAQDKAAAQALFNEGKRLMSEGNYEAACPKLVASLELVPGLGTRGKLAECYEKAGQTASAWAQYREVAALAKRAGDSRREQVATQRADRLEAQLAYLTIDVPGDARVPGLIVKLDGNVIKAGAFGTPVAVDPGAHQVEATATGYEPWSSEVEVAAEAKASAAVPALTKLPEPVTPDPTPGVGTGPVDAPTGDKKSNKKLYGMIGVGVGGASIVVGSVFGLSARSKWNEAFDDGHCSDANVCSAEGQALTDDARSAATKANIFVGAGVAIAAVGAYLWFTAPTDDAEAQTAVRVMPVATDEEVGFAISGSF